jgi:hypothetical protein
MGENKPDPRLRHNKNLTKNQKKLVWLEIFCMPFVVSIIISLFLVFSFEFEWSDYRVIIIITSGIGLGILFAELIRYFVGLKEYDQTSLISTNDIDEAIENEREKAKNYSK